MKVKAMFILTVLILLPSMAFSTLTGEIRLSLIEGDVQVRPGDTEEWFPASINTPVLEGDRLWVPDRGRLELQLRDGSILRLNENTSIDVLRMEDGSLQFYINSGSAYINFTGRKGYLQIDTSAASIRVYERSRFRVDVPEDGRVDVSTYSGNVYVESGRGRTSVRTGNMLSIRDQEYAELSPLGPPDEWERWNRERDRKLTEKRYSYRYLPDELRPYSYDFDENGRWVYVRDYGYVWTPTVYISAGWAPYRHGRWVWIRGDYVWVAYEPWGWVPYHYGRWAFVASIGWCWVPPARGAVYWGPGFVGWVYTPTYVAWVPLAPGEIYYGYGYYGPHSVNIINIDIHNVVVKEYRHAHIRDAITIVHRDTFLKGKPVEVKVHENPFLAHKIHIGRPPIEPVRETRAPIIKEIMRGKEPPSRIRELDIKKLREHRPIVRERDISVMRPGERLKEFPIEKLRKPLKPEERLKERPLRPLEEKPFKGPEERLMRKPEEKPRKPQGPEEKLRERPLRPFEERGPALKRKEESRGPVEPPLKPPRATEEKGFRGFEDRMRKPEMKGPDRIRRTIEDKGKGEKEDGIPPTRPFDRDRFKGKEGIKEQGHSGPQDIRKTFEGRGASEEKRKVFEGKKMKAKEQEAPPSSDSTDKKKHKDDLINRLRR